MTTVEKVYAHALELTAEERVELAQMLMLDPDEQDSGWYARIKPEVDRRSARIESGEAKTTPWPEVRKMLFERANGNRD